MTRLLMLAAIVAAVFATTATPAVAWDRGCGGGEGRAFAGVGRGRVFDRPVFRPWFRNREARPVAVPATPAVVPVPSPAVTSAAHASAVWKKVTSCGCAEK